MRLGVFDSQLRNIDWDAVFFRVFLNISDNFIGSAIDFLVELFFLSREIESREIRVVFFFSFFLEAVESHLNKMSKGRLFFSLSILENS